LEYPKTLSLDRPVARKGSAGSPFGQEVTNPTLDVFVYGEENAAVAGLFRVSQVSRLADWSPVLLFGPHLVGKTSLAASLGARYVRATNSKTTFHCDGGDFARALVTAIESDDMDRFRKRHRECSLLIIDGLQGLTNRTSAQEELIATLDHRAEEKLPTIMTSMVLPSAIRGLKTNLVSRCLGGLSVELVYPGSKARLKIIQLLSKKLDIPLAEVELERLANRFTDSISVPELNGLLLKWSHRERVALQQAPTGKAQVLEELIDARDQSKIPEVGEIAKRVARECNLKLSDLRGATRRSQIVRARSLAMYLTRELTQLSFQQIGEYFGKRDHTTVMHACRKLESDLTVDRDLSRMADEVRRQLK
jgi:chromosomal replication initiator protein